jgi:hypothetical protein
VLQGFRLNEKNDTSFSLPLSQGTAEPIFSRLSYEMNTENKKEGRRLRSRWLEARKEKNRGAEAMSSTRRRKQCSTTTTTTSNPPLRRRHPRRSIASGEDPACHAPGRQHIRLIVKKRQRQ